MSTTAEPGSGPLLFCYDGSPDSGAALGFAADALSPRSSVVLTVWATAATRLTYSGVAPVFGGAYIPNEADIDIQEQEAAQRAVDHGLRAAAAHGWKPTARVEQTDSTIWRTIVDVANEIDASIIVCGARGQNPVARAALGSVSEAVLHHSHRPMLITPERRG